MLLRKTSHDFQLVRPVFVGSTCTSKWIVEISFLRPHPKSPPTDNISPESLRCLEILIRSVSSSFVVCLSFPSWLLCARTPRPSGTTSCLRRFLLLLYELAYLRRQAGICFLYNGWTKLRRAKFFTSLGVPHLHWLHSQLPFCACPYYDNPLPVGLSWGSPCFLFAPGVISIPFSGDLTLAKQNGATDYRQNGRLGG